MRLLKTKKNFRKELKRQLRYAIAAAVGFLIIYAWRESILRFTELIVVKTQDGVSWISSALIITIIGVLIIILSSKLLKD